MIALLGRAFDLGFPVHAYFGAGVVGGGLSRRVYDKAGSHVIL